MLDVLEKRQFLPPYSPPYERSSSRSITIIDGGEKSFEKNHQVAMDTLRTPLYGYERSMPEGAINERGGDRSEGRSTSLTGSFTLMSISAPSPKRFYTVAQVCEYLAIGKTTFYKEVKEGHLQTVKVRGGTRVTSETLEAYYEAKIDESRSYRALHPGRWSK